jgi:2-polyprenyl-3-methyl-5-hydroxy-6-metoxy-1,4-benzoquinol methylase
VAQEDHLAPECLIKVFELEQVFHSRILATEDPNERKRQYAALYNEVHHLKQAGSTVAFHSDSPNEVARQSRLALTFRREISGRSLLDVGCGAGLFLRTVHKLVSHGRLCGIDTSAVRLPAEDESIRFVQSDVVRFQIDAKFDVVFSHQVLEHIAPADLPAHLSSIRNALEDGGKLIVCLPNRYWGPQDVTRIIDNSFRGKVPAMGSHLNESSYTELVPVLESYGFSNCRTILPLAAFLPAVSEYRVRPWFNRLIETQGTIRTILNLIRASGKPIFKNPIILICDK